MANVLHKTADPVDYRVSVNTPDFPTADWFIDPDVSAVAGVPKKHWARPLTDPVTEMSQAEKDAVDAAILAAAYDSLADSMTNTEDVLRAFARTVLDEINLLRQQFNTTTSESNQLTDTTFSDRTISQLRTAIRNYLGT